VKENIFSLPEAPC